MSETQADQDQKCLSPVAANTANIRETKTSTVWLGGEWLKHPTCS